MPRVHALFIPYCSHLRLRIPSSWFPSGLLRSYPGEKPGSGGSRRYHTWPRPPAAPPADNVGLHGSQANRGSRSSVALAVGPGCKNHWVIVLQWCHMGALVSLTIDGSTFCIFFQQPLYANSDITSKLHIDFPLWWIKHWWAVNSLSQKDRNTRSASVSWRLHDLWNQLFSRPTYWGTLDTYTLAYAIMVVIGRPRPSATLTWTLCRCFITMTS